MLIAEHHEPDAVYEYHRAADICFNGRDSTWGVAVDTDVQSIALHEKSGELERGDRVGFWVGSSGMSFVSSTFLF